MRTRNSGRPLTKVFGEAFFPKSFEECRLFEKRRHPETLVIFYQNVVPDPLLQQKTENSRI
ncbi:hypothetical protein F1542_11125 [Komagataeibacter sp. FXV3]|nr:hypothetical protein [Komagataeibacter sp. FXV3]